MAPGGLLGGPIVETGTPNDIQNVTCFRGPMGESHVEVVVAVAPGGLLGSSWGLLGSSWALPGSSWDVFGGSEVLLGAPGGSF